MCLCYGKDFVQVPDKYHVLIICVHENVDFSYRNSYHQEPKIELSVIGK